MLRIGEFACLAGVSVKALRFYSNAGLLRPSAVDPWTGYRRYESGQLAVLRRILALKGLGFSLREIAAILDDPQQLRERLRQLRGRLSREAQAASRRLLQLDGLLDSTHADPFQVVVRRSVAFHALSVRDRVAAYEEIEELFREVERRAPRRGVRGRAAAWHASSSGPGRIDAEALLIVDSSCPGAVEIGARDVVSTVYSGNGWQAPYARLAAWLAEHRCALAGPKLERLLSDDLVEVQFPIRYEVSA